MIKNNSVTLGKDYDEMLKLLKTNELFSEYKSSQNIKTIYQFQQEQIDNQQKQIDELRKEIDDFKQSLGVAMSHDADNLVKTMDKNLKEKKDNLAKFVEAINDKSKNVVDNFKTNGKKAFDNLKEFMEKKTKQFLTSELLAEKKLQKVIINSIDVLKKPLETLKNSSQKRIDSLEEKINSLNSNTQKAYDIQNNGVRGLQFENTNNFIKQGVGEINVEPER